MTDKIKKNLKSKTKTELIQIAQALEALETKKKYNYVLTLFPDQGVHKRELYPKHLDFFKAGLKYTRRAFIAGNRIGKTLAGALELYYHASGDYPEWWNGKRFDKPINAWVCGVTNQVMRESIQELLFGSFSDKGTGIIPRSKIVDDKGQIQCWAMPGTPNMVGTVLINHKTGGKSKVEFKTYDQGYEKFQGAKRDVIWLDEEPSDSKIYTECATRTAGATGKEGILYCTFTPLKGYSDVVLQFLPNGIVPKSGEHPKNPSKFVICAGWRDVPHLSEDWKKQQILEYGPNEIKARTEGIPSMGSGRIYPVEEEYVCCRPFQIPEYWPRAYGLDFGWHATAAIWIAQDPTTKVLYVYSTYKRGNQAPYVHANAIKAKGDWLVGAADPSGGGRSSNDGTLLIDHYRSMGLQLIDGQNSISAGIARILNLLESGSLKFFSNLEDLLNEFRVYRYDIHDPNKPAKNQEDHLLDSLKYCISMFDYISRTEDDDDNSDEEKYSRIDKSRDSLTGY